MLDHLISREEGFAVFCYVFAVFGVFLGPRGPLGVQPSVRPSVRAKNFNQWKFTINHYIIMSDLSYHIFSESS